jgi:hypothetical protein
MDHFRTRRKRSSSLPGSPAALVPTAEFWGLIIFPRTPPEEFAPTVSTGLTPNLLRRDLLQIDEEGVGGGVRAGEGDPKPPDERGEVREQETRVGVIYVPFSRRSHSLGT